MRRAGGWFHVKKLSHLRCKCPMISSCIGKCRCESFLPSLSSSIDWLTDWLSENSTLATVTRECVKWEKQFKTISSRHAVTILNFATIKKTIKHNYRRRAQLDRQYNAFALSLTPQNYPNEISIDDCSAPMGRRRLVSSSIRSEEHTSELQSR